MDSNTSQRLKNTKNNRFWWIGGVYSGILTALVAIIYMKILTTVVNSFCFPYNMILLIISACALVSLSNNIIAEQIVKLGMSMAKYEMRNKK